jgi:hypothetical protein
MPDFKERKFYYWIIYTHIYISQLYKIFARKVFIW